MKITVLFIKIDEKKQSIIGEEKIFAIEEALQNLNKNILLEITSDGFFVYREDLKNKENVVFLDFIEEGKFFKKILIENTIASEEDYKQFFALKQLNIVQEEQKIPNNDDIDRMIAKVDRNDPKLLEVLSKIEKIKKSR